MTTMATRTPRQRADDTLERARLAMARRMAAMAADLPPGYYTEIKGPEGVFKIRDFAAALKYVSEIGGPPGVAADVEDWGPLVELLKDKDEEDDGF